MTPVRIPPLLPEGSTLGLVCTGSPPDPTQLDAGREWVASQGYAIRSGRTTEARGGIHALSPKERAEELDRFLSDPEIDGILCVRGGSGTMGMLPHLDYAAAAEHPKPVIGMSDVTALHLALLARSRLVGIAGRMVGQLARERTPYTTARWLEMLRGPWPTHEPLALPAATRLEVLHPGNAEGPLLPCNFSLLAAMIGTPYFPDLHGAILLVEEIDERPEGLDRMVGAMALSGVDRRLGGLVLGQFTHCVPRNPKLTEEDGRRLIREWAGSLGVPALAGFPFGHEAISCSLPFGSRARVTTDPPGLELRESPPAPAA